MNNALKDIYNKVVDVKTEIEPNLFKISFDSQNKAVDTGFVDVKFGEPDFDFINELKYNNGVFAAFRTHRQQNDLAKQLLDDKGNLKSFDQFKQDTQPILGEYNKNWLQTEYDTAVIRARMAAKFKKFQQTADVLPNLKWLPTTSPDPRESHEKFYYIVRPLNDPFWNDHFPGNEWNCKCGITSTDEAVTDLPEGYQSFDDPPAGLDQNPAFTGQIYSFSHPYFTIGYLAYKKLMPLVQKWLDDYFENKPPMFPIYTKIVSQKGINISITKTFQAQDAKMNITIAKKIGVLLKDNKQEATIYILPALMQDVPVQNKLRKYLLPKDTPAGKNPDFLINRTLFDCKITKGGRNSLQSYVSDANKQASGVIIDYQGKLSYNEVLKAIIGQAKYCNKLQDFWIIYRGELNQFKRKTWYP